MLDRVFLFCFFKLLEVIIMNSLVTTILYCSVMVHSSYWKHLTRKQTPKYSSKDTPKYSYSICLIFHPHPGYFKHLLWMIELMWVLRRAYCKNRVYCTHLSFRNLRTEKNPRNLIIWGWLLLLFTISFHVPVGLFRMHGTNRLQSSAAVQNRAMKCKTKDWKCSPQKLEFFSFDSL